MTNGIIQTQNGFAVKDFSTEKLLFYIGDLSFASYQDAVNGCRGRFYPDSYYPYLITAADLEKAPDADVWENMVYAGNPKGIYDGEQCRYRNVTAVDKGAATEHEIDYMDALAFTYDSLKAMIK